MRPIIYPYKLGSKSAKALQVGLREARCDRPLRVRRDGNYRPYRNHLVINWGNSTAPHWGIELNTLDNVLNHWLPVARASNKLKAFERMQLARVSIPEFTTSKQEASQWYSEGHMVVGRAKLTGHSGEGIYLTDPLDYPQAEGGMDVQHMSEIEFGLYNAHLSLPLYVKYIKKKHEYRVHVFRGEVIDIQQKRKRRDVDNEEVNYKIRNHDNGWVFCRDDIDAPNPGIPQQAINAVSALGLDFGAVDVIWNDHHQRAYVLEVNTAPGLEGTTITKYVNKIKELL